MYTHIHTYIRACIREFSCMHMYTCDRTITRTHTTTHTHVIARLLVPVSLKIVVLNHSRVAVLRRDEVQERRRAHEALQHRVKEASGRRESTRERTRGHCSADRQTPKQTPRQGQGQRRQRRTRARARLRLPGELTPALGCSRARRAPCARARCWAASMHMLARACRRAPARWRSPGRLRTGGAETSAQLSAGTHVLPRLASPHAWAGCESPQELSSTRRSRNSRGGCHHRPPCPRAAGVSSIGSAAQPRDARSQHGLPGSGVGALSRERARAARAAGEAPARGPAPPPKGLAPGPLPARYAGPPDPRAPAPRDPAPRRLSTFILPRPSAPCS